MSFADRSHGENRAIAVIAVAALEVGMIVAVAQGLAVAFLDQPEAAPPVVANNIPLPQTPPSAAPQDPVKPDSSQKEGPQVKAVDSGLTKSQQDGEVITFTSTGTTNLGGGLIALPSDPPPVFEPRLARALNDRALWVRESDYPRSDLHLGHEGTTRFRLSIDANGRVTDCSIVDSSGYPGLDAATCGKVTQRARFEPARDTAGARVAGSYTGSVRWVIPE